MTKYLSYEIDTPASEACPTTMEEAFGTTLLQRGNSSPSYVVKNLQLCLMEGGFLTDEKGADGYFGKTPTRPYALFRSPKGLTRQAAPERPPKPACGTCTRIS